MGMGIRGIMLVSLIEVNNMIEKMIFRLMDEQKKEDEHKHWYDLQNSPYGMKLNV